MTAKWSIAFLPVAALIFAAPAAADPNDDAFIATLTKNGIVVNDRDTATTLGQSVCDSFDQHQKSSAVAMRLVARTDMSLKQSSYFVGVAIAAYCPEYTGKTDPSARWMNPGPPLM